MLDRVLRIGLLYDLYGALLTDKQRRCIEMHYLNDDSLAEIAEEFQVSRQAVHDILRRGEQILEEYEAKLKLADRYHHEQATILKISELLGGLPNEIRQKDNIIQAIELLKQLTNQEEEI